jgi:hypothetical protein
MKTMDEREQVVAVAVRGAVVGAVAVRSRLLVDEGRANEVSEGFGGAVRLRCGEHQQSYRERGEAERVGVFDEPFCKGLSARRARCRAVNRVK